MKRKVTVPLPVQAALKLIPSGVIVRTLARFPVALTVIPIVPKAGWVEITLEDANCLKKYTDNQIRNLLMLFYLKTPPEFCYRNFVAGMYPDSRVEVHTSVGIVDVVTPNWVIEVKVASSWKHALGQAIAYAHVTGKAPAVALFGEIPAIARDIFSVQGVDILELCDV